MIYNKHTFILKIIITFSYALVILKPIECKLKWKIKPQEYQIANEYDNVKLNCEFEDKDSKDSNSNQYFVIWYRDGSSQNVLSLNDKLANLNSTNYEIIGKYNLLIKNVTKNHSGLYTCQLFQSSDLIASVNLTILVPPKYAKINVKQSEGLNINKDYLVENDRIELECCTNSDSNPAPVFEWYKVDRISSKPHLLQSYLNKTFLSKDKLCNYLSLNLTKSDNNFVYKCSITNDALKNRKPIDDNILLSVEYKPEVNVHLSNKPSVNNRLRLNENSSISLYCNSSAIPNVQSYQWYFNDLGIRDQQTNYLNLKNLNKFNSGVYSCKATNKHGSSVSSIQVEIQYARLSAFNKTYSLTESTNLRQPNSIYVNTYENTSISLTCELDSNPFNQKITWFFYQINKENKIVNKVMLSNWISVLAKVVNQSQKVYYSQLNLINVTSNHSGYYTCSIQTRLTDDLNQNFSINQNASYFLQVQYTPIVRAVKKVTHANNYDQVELSCEIRSNPQSIFSWYMGNKELSTNYKYNLTNTVYKQIHRAYLDDLDNIHYYRTTLVINSLTQFDYGDYYCRANNIIGENGQLLKLKKKQKPESPIDLKIIEASTNGVKLSWLSSSNGGENSTYLITINNSFNLTTISDEDYSETESENKYNLVELKGLQSNTEYNFKLLAFNSMGSSDYTNSVNTHTSESSLKSDQLPEILNAQYNELREAICFEIDHLIERDYNIKDLIIRIDVSLNQNWLNLELNETLIDFKLNTSKPKSYILNMNKIKYGQNCISFSQLIELDWELRNSTIYSSTKSNRQSDNIFSINPALIINEPKMLTTEASIGKNFYEFRKINNVNLSICYLNDSSICSNKIKVKNYNPDFSTYITLIAIGCSAILIFIILLIASLCCCCCRRRKSSQKQSLKNELGSKLVIKSFPINNGTAQQGTYDYSDSSCKSSQQHILNGSASTHSSGSSTYSRANEKIFYQNDQVFENNIITNKYKMEYNHNMSSAVESDASSSTSIENKTTSTSNGKSSSNHSPYTIPGDNQQNVFFGYSNQIKACKQQSQLINNGVYIKSFQQGVKNSNSVESPESGYSTPITNTTSNSSKKLVYEVIV